MKTGAKTRTINADVRGISETGGLMFGVKLSMVGLLLLSVPAAPAAQRTAAAVTREAAPVFSSGVDMVTVNVSVRDRRGRIVRGLACRDFRLVDSGFGRPIRGVFESAAALRIAVLLDVSGSMAMDGNIAHARSVVRSIVGALQPGRDEAALFAFDSGLREIVPFTTELDRFDTADLSGRPYGRTSLYDAVADTASLVGGSGDRHHALLVVTDGVDTGSRRTVEEVSGVASTIAVQVHLLTVGGVLARRGGPGAAGAAGATLADLARWTGGSVRAAGAREDMLEAVEELLPGLRHQYVLTFRPGFRRGWHPIEILTADDRLAVHARRGYVAGRAKLDQRLVARERPCE